MSKVFVFDIDGTMINNRTFPNMLTRARVDIPQHGVIAGQGFSVEEFAALPWRYEDVSVWDFSEWDNEEKNVESILRSDLIDANVHLMEEYRNMGYDIKFLTARGGGMAEIEDAISQALSERFGFDITGFAIGDYRTYGTNKEVKMPVKKQRVLQQLVQEYDEVVFIDDEDTNLELAREVGGVNAIKAIGS